MEASAITREWAPLQDQLGNWKEDYGGYPSGNDPPLRGDRGFRRQPGYDPKAGELASAEEMTNHNLCLYLSEDGLSLEEEAQYIWRMPTIDDYARSFARHGENAGCEWKGESNEQMDCAILPDKETPLWAPDLELSILGSRGI